MRGAKSLHVPDAPALGLFDDIGVRARKTDTYTNHGSALAKNGHIHETLRFHENHENHASPVAPQIPYLGALE